MCYNFKVDEAKVERLLIQKTPFAVFTADFLFGC
jgi:hypothetical protein